MLAGGIPQAPLDTTRLSESPEEPATRTAQLNFTGYGVESGGVSEATFDRHITMLHPNQFAVNEAWLVFQLNETPIHTELEGDFNCIALMDAASCFILGNAFAPAGEAEPSQTAVRRMLKEAKAHQKGLPTTLFIPSGQFDRILAAEAQRQGIAVVRVPEDQLLVFIGPARELFKEHFGGDSMQ